MQTVFTLCLALAALGLARLFFNWRQLAHVPGPRLAALSDFWRAYHQRRGTLRGKLIELHEQYGSVVRYGVRSVSINDQSVVDIAYGSRAGFIIADSYKVLIGISHGKEVPSLITIADEARHTALRRSVLNAFSPNASLDYEPHIDRTIEELLEAVRGKSTIDLAAVLSYYGLDAAGRFAFNEPMGNLAANKDVAGTITLTRERMGHYGRWASLPGLERLIYRNPIAMRMKQAPFSMVAAAAKRLNERLEKPQPESEAPDLLSRFLQSSEKNPAIVDQRGVLGLLMSTITAAGDTTANALLATLFHLLKQPKALRKLQEEFSAVELNRPVPTFAQVSKLPYLHACIREGLRLFPPLTAPLERKVPESGASVAGTFLPEGTSVGCLQIALHLNTKIFGDDAAVFRPERWLEVEPERLRTMEAAHMGFSRGRRVCIGQHIAVMQMKKAIPALLLAFDMSLVDPAAELDADFTLAVTCPKAVDVNVRAKA